MSLGILTTYRAGIQEGLKSALAGGSRLRSILRYHAGLEDEAGRPADATGKFLRPSLVLFIATQLGADIEQAMPAAIGLELIHNFSLIHDDIQDADRTRRGRPTVWTVWGTNEAINAGDLMQAIAVSCALRAGSDVAGVLLAATDEMIEGQSLDLGFESRQATLDEYLRMIDRKTGALLRAAFTLGGVVAGADASVRRTLLILGSSIGRAFQIQDDLLGVWGDSGVVGKPCGSDIRRGKKSYPTILAFERARDEELSLLESIYARDEVTDEDVAWVMALMNRHRIRETGQQTVRSHLEESESALDALGLSPAGRNDMNELLEYLAGRSK